jgi:hypothetical protein
MRQGGFYFIPDVLGNSNVWDENANTRENGSQQHTITHLKTKNHRPMKKLLTTAMIIALAMPAMAQKKGKSCNPTNSQTDKFTKKQIDTWGYWIEGTSFGEALWKSDHLMIYLAGQVYGGENYLQIKASIWDKSAQSAQFGGKIEGTKGKSFFLAFADGESLEFIATDAAENKSNYNSRSELYEHSVFYATKIADEDIQKLKERFSNHLLTACRLQLENGNNLDQSFVEKHSREMQRILTCFFERISGN